MADQEQRDTENEWAAPEPVRFEAEQDLPHPQSSVASPSLSTERVPGGEVNPLLQAEPDTFGYTDPDHLPEDVEVVTEEDLPHPQPLSEFGEGSRAEDEANTLIQAEPDTLAYTDPDHLPEDVEVVTEEDLPHPTESSQGSDTTPELDSPSPNSERGSGGEVNDLESTQPLTVLDIRLDALTRKIEQYPNSPVNYVLRGEVYSEGGDADLAAADFTKAIELAEQHDQALDWGYINAAYIDRAWAGLRALNRL